MKAIGYVRCLTCTGLYRGYKRGEEFDDLHVDRADRD